MKGLIKIKETKTKRMKKKEIRKNLIIKTARDIFSRKGIENSVMTEIAQEAGIGVASIYRYFSTKTNIAIEVGVDYWKSIIEKYEEKIINDINDSSYNGIEKVTSVLNIFADLFRNDKNFLVFIEDFDNYIVKNHIEAQEIEEYEKGIKQLALRFIEILHEGKRDGTIRSDLDERLFYYTITHALISLSQKLTLRGSILNMDNEVDGEAQINALINMAIGSLK